MLIDAINKAVKLKFTKVVNEPQSRLQVVTAEVPQTTMMLGTKHRMTGGPIR
jgi:hypothetical protein